MSAFNNRRELIAMKPIYVVVPNGAVSMPALWNSSRDLSMCSASSPRL